MTLWEKIRTVIHKMIPYSSVEQALRVQIAVSPEMRERVKLWCDLYTGAPYWLKPGDHTTNTAALVASELARMVTVEMSSTVTGGARAAFLDESYQGLIESIREPVEYGCAKGGLVFKPFVRDGRIRIDTVQGDAFFPIACDSARRITDAVFANRVHQNGMWFTKLERQRFEGGTLTITNTAYKSRNETDLGVSINLSEVAQWSEILPSAKIVHIDRPLFGYFRVPHANHEDDACPLGASVFARAVKQLRDADEQYNRIRWEYKGSELAVHADATLFRRNPRTGCFELPEGFERYYRMCEAQDGDFGLQAWSPEIRDESLFRGLNRYFQRIEDLCGLARGTIADQNGEAKTATELKIMRQRSYSTVTDMQKALQNALTDLVYSMDVLTTVYQLAPPGDYELNFRFDDSVLTDSDAQRETDRQDVRDGLMTKWEYRMKWYGEDEETARKMAGELDGGTDDDLFGFRRGGG